MQYQKPKQLAETFSCCPKTMRDVIHEMQLKDDYKGSVIELNGHYRAEVSAVEKYLKERKRKR